MNKKDVLAWIEGFEAAKEVERRLLQNEPLDRDRSVRLALSLIAACRAQGLSDPKREHQVEKVRNSWIRLRKAYAK